MRAITILGLALVCACGRGEPAPADAGLDAGSSVFITSPAALENGLPYDGCTWVITIDDARYGPASGSIPLVEQYAAGRIGRLPVTLSWRATGETTSVACGWGGSTQLPEIAIQSIADAGS
jgi:hypothetical protein